MSEKTNKFNTYIKKKTDKNYIKSLFTSKAFRVGTYSTFSVIAVIAIAVVLNMIVEKLPSDYTKFDLTKNKFFTVSDQTEQIVSELDTEVDIYLLAESGTEDENITQLLEKYKGLSKNIKIINKDPVVYPSFAKQYTSEKLYNNSIIVVCNNKSRYISYYDIYVADYSNYSTSGSYSSKFNGESSITSAIDYVTNKNLPKMYVMTGNGEKSIDEELSKSIKNQNVEIENLNLLTLDKVPDDADCLFIYSPSRDISDGEKEKIQTYLKKGGNLLLITDYSKNKMPNLSEIEKYYGVTLVDGIVFEGDNSLCLKGYNHYLLPNIANHSITSPLRKGGFYALMPIAQGIKQIDDKKSTLSITELLTTSNKAFSKKNIDNIKTTDKETGDIDGPFALGMAVTDKNNDIQSHFVWFTTSEMLEQKVDQMVSGANTDLLLNSIGWMCERENTISIHAKSLDAEHLTVPSSSAAFWSLIMVGVLPVLFIVAGIFVWYRRKNR